MSQESNKTQILTERATATSALAAVSTHTAWAIGAAFAVLTFVLLLVTTGSVGVTWDEPIYNTTAEAAARWLALIAQGNFSQAFDPFTFGVSWGLANEHPPLLRIINGLGWALTRNLLPVPTSHRIGGLILAALAIGMLVTTQARQHGLAAGLFAGAALLTMPRVFFHAQLAALDFPVAALWWLATLGFYLAVQRPRWWSPLLIGTGLGLALLTKINAVLLIPYWALWLLVFRRERRAWLAFTLGLPVGLFVLIAGWPWIWKDPLGGLINWVKFFRFHFEIRQWFAGHLYVDTPWYLPPAIVGITTPTLLLALAAFGVLTAHRRRPAGESHATLASSGWTWLHLLGLTVVMGYYMLPITAVHDQDRLLMPVFVHLAALAGDGFMALADGLERFGKGLRQNLGVRFPRGPINSAPNTIQAQSRPMVPARVSLRAALGILLLLPGVAGIIRLHPFELSYYNGLVGGPKGAARMGMETIYFASTYGYFLPYLNELPSGSRLWVMPNSWDVLYYYQLNGLLRRDLVLLRPPGWGSFYDSQGVPWEEGGLERADFALIERRQTTFNDMITENAIQLQWAAGKSEIARLERAGVVLATLHRR